MAGKLGGDDEEGIVDINITPFVDIVLVVLIIFMVTATYIVQKDAIKVELPDAATGENTETTSLGLTLTEGGELYLDGADITEDGLREFIRTEKRRITVEGGDLICLIAADKTVPHGDVIALIDLIRQEGVAKFALNIEGAELPPEAAGAVGAPVGGAADAP